ncbi:TraR/DksA family transcriptional regulator [Salmonella enterica subsp. enterica]|nr:TraR/DksA family transcriptional regulator [Salmonella enterica subsp. enterica]ECY3918067.1 TraR/DksA family transcriptional regulator [Salmonella enterica subsp. enterica serovar Brunei]EEF3371065.1 TraR/DksA family transcriptional regulator [Salmonella enterica]ECC3110666.1 TraR/DksA family transcriptional regulator [Salmonella enterica subsp. enterica]ECJ4032078.1 TraR/DksA family transcriptional regulator [Salmonella enterica subsp. enterica]
MTPDTLDAASELTQQRIEMAVAAHRLNHSAVSATHCEECQIDIPELRRKLIPGTRLCIDCAKFHEQKLKVSGVN